MDTTQTTTYGGLASATRVGTMATATFFDEISYLLYEERWMLLFLLLLIVCDFRYGWGESHKRYTIAKDNNDNVLAEHYRWHTSRAIRRTCNKFMDYVALMLLCTALGKWMLPPIGIEYIFGAYAGSMIALFCEIRSLGGHFLYLRGVNVSEHTVWGMIKSFAVSLAKKKDSDIGEALEETLSKSDKEQQDKHKEQEK